MTTIFAPAKVNLYLAILGKDASGYHELDTVYARYEALQDEIEIETAPLVGHASDIRFIPADGIDPEDNTLIKALRVLEAHTGRVYSYTITVHKNIPIQSGLGGASSDAAALLLYLNTHENLNLSAQTLLELGMQIGMDVPFFLSGFAVARGTHYGEILAPLPPLPPALHLEVGFTGIPVSTKEAFAKWDRLGLKSTAPGLATLSALDLPFPLHNDFEQIFSDLSFKNPTTVLTGSGGAFVHLQTGLPKQ
jgi:4-diphosphocytidyl-2-C-methyl-D-erythritol kinase